MSTAKTAECQLRVVDDLLFLRDMLDGANFVEDLISERTSDSSRELRPINASDVRLLIGQLYRPFDHVALLHGKTRAAMSGHGSWLCPSHQRLMTIESEMWPGAWEATQKKAKAFSMRFRRGRVSLDEAAVAIGVAQWIHQIARGHVGRVERKLKAERIGNPAALLGWEKGTWYGEDVRSLKESPGDANAPW